MNFHHGYCPIFIFFFFLPLPLSHSPCRVLQTSFCLFCVPPVHKSCKIQYLSVAKSTLEQKPPLLKRSRKRDCDTAWVIFTRRIISLFHHTCKTQIFFLCRRTLLNSSGHADFLLTQNYEGVCPYTCQCLINSYFSIFWCRYPNNEFITGLCTHADMEPGLQWLLEHLARHMFCLNFSVTLL